MTTNQKFSIFHLTEKQAIELLDTDPQNLESPSDRYIAATQLVNYPTSATIDALIRAVQTEAPTLDTRIVRRKAVETLGYIKADIALPIIQECLQDDDCYTVENAAWAIGEIGTQSPEILSDITNCLKRPNQNYRLIIHTLAKLNCREAIKEISRFIQSSDLSIQSAAISATCQLTEETSAMAKVIPFLQDNNVTVRRSCVQDFIDTHYHPAIPAIATSPISMVFRLRGIQQIAQSTPSLPFETIQSPLEAVIRDHPNTVEMVHEYDQPPTLEFLLNELYETDFGRCYLASQTLLTQYPSQAPEALVTNFQERGKGDYGAHYHIIKLLGWLKHSAAYDLIIEALHNPLPQFQKSRTAAAIALGELTLPKAIPDLQSALSTEIWALQYASLLALSKLEGLSAAQSKEINLRHPLVKAKLDTYI
ncbi:MAG: HEAT repeat domain-containing protein [Cyanobacteria bacterium P01_F01_bin.42]